MWHSTRPFRLFLPPALSVDWRLPRSLSHWSTGHAITSGPRLSAQVAGQTNQDLLVLVNETTKDFELSPLLKTLTTELTSHHIPTRMAALRWISMLLEKAPQVPTPLPGHAPRPATAHCHVIPAAPHHALCMLGRT